jgi:prophage lp2 protein 6
MEIEVELKTKLEQLYNRVESLKNQINTEEATKNAFIMPFLQILGYDVFNPTEVVPEYVADIGIKKGEKVDYVIKKDEQVILIVECKHWKEDVDAYNSQLHRYYHVTDTRFAIITNGIIYNFFTDLEKPNVMDNNPFLTVNLANLKDSTIKELVKFTKATFSIDNILESAEALKYVRAFRNEFEKEIQEPSDDFIKLLARRFFDKQITANRLENFNSYLKRAITSYFNDTINARLKSALNINENKEQHKDETGDTSANEVEEDNRIVTTEEEIEGFQIVKAILREKLPASRIAYRDAITYFGVLLDDNNRKPICRLHFNGIKKYIEFFDKGKDNPERVLIDSLDDIYTYKERLLHTIENYD